MFALVAKLGKFMGRMGHANSPHSTAHVLVAHGGVALALTPQLGYVLGLDDLKHAPLLVEPPD